LYKVDKSDINGIYIEGNIKRFSTSYDNKAGLEECDNNKAELKLKKKTGIATSKSVRKYPFEV
jgi:hypothetical protein